MPSALQSRLDDLLRQHDHAARRDADPVGYVHRFGDPADQEIVALLASALAFGNVVAVRASVERVLAVLGTRPARAITRGRRRLEGDLHGFVHRVYRGPDLAFVLARAAALRERHGSLGALVAAQVAEHGLREGLARFAGVLRGDDAPRGRRHLVPDPRAGSACKRLLLLMRWMCRPADGVDLGLWSVPPSALVIPVDTHIQRIAYNLRLTTRRDASWRTAEAITASLRRFDAEDPVKYDFALCHLGVSRDCPSRQDEAKCGSCVLRSVCRQWSTRR